MITQHGPRSCGWDLNVSLLTRPSCGLIASSASLPVPPLPAVLAHLGLRQEPCGPPSTCGPPWPENSALTRAHCALVLSRPTLHPSLGLLPKHPLEASRRERTFKVSVIRPVPAPFLETEQHFAAQSESAGC